MKLKNNKKGQAIFSQLGGMAIGIVTLAIVLVVGFLVMSQATDQIGSIEGVTCTGNSSLVANGGGTSVACNATHTLQAAMATVPGWVPLIVIAIIGSILLGLVALFQRR